MDVFVILCLILGTICSTEVTGLLHCLECTHIIWDQDNKNYFINQEQMQGNPPQNGFSWIKGIEDMLAVRYTPACAESDPSLWNRQSDPNFQLGNTIVEVSEDVCRAESSAERCTFMYGNVDVYISQYDKTIKLIMYIRGCKQDLSPLLEDRCYDRNNLGLSGTEFRTDFQNKLYFFGQETTVTFIQGRQCTCSYNRCITFTQGSKAVSGSIITIIMAAVTYLVLKV